MLNLTGCSVENHYRMQDPLHQNRPASRDLAKPRAINPSPTPLTLIQFCPARKNLILSLL